MKKSNVLCLRIFIKRQKRQYLIGLILYVVGGAVLNVGKEKQAKLANY